jgi:hypothetical protein
MAVSLCNPWYFGDMTPKKASPVKLEADHTSGGPFAQLSQEQLDLIIFYIESFGEVYGLFCSCKRLALAGRENKPYYEAAALVKRKFEVIWASPSRNLMYSLKYHAIGIGECHLCTQCHENNGKLISLIWHNNNSFWGENCQKMLKTMAFVPSHIKEKVHDWDKYSALVNSINVILFTDSVKQAKAFFNLHKYLDSMHFLTDAMLEVNEENKQLFAKMRSLYFKGLNDHKERLLFLNTVGSAKIAGIEKNEEMLGKQLDDLRPRRNQCLVDKATEDVEKGVRPIILAGANHTQAEVFSELGQRKIAAISLFSHPKHEIKENKLFEMFYDMTKNVAIESLHSALMKADDGSITAIINSNPYIFSMLLIAAIKRQMEMNRAEVEKVQVQST